MDQAINGTVDNESYTILEAGFRVAEGLSVYANYSTTGDAKLPTIRTRVNSEYNKYSSFTVDCSMHSFGFNKDLDSIDLRIAISF